MSDTLKKSILVVDDEEIIREFLFEVLSEDYEITLAADGDEAIEKLGQRGFDLIITDLKMPRVSGEEVVKYAKSRNPACPVIVISGYSTLFAASESVNHGACAFLSKPFSIIELTKTVSDHLEGDAA
ncbi:MAG TPA: response regulator [candidate division Zixibacteria bacterium]|nr:response regulator [candidate division Zixibacteria bacterium]